MFKAFSSSATYVVLFSFQVKVEGFSFHQKGIFLHPRAQAQATEVLGKENSGRGRPHAGNMNGPFTVVVGNDHISVEYKME